MMSNLVQYDAALLQKLGLSEQEAQELEANGVSLQEYAEMVGSDLDSEADQIDARPVRWQIVHAARAFTNEATGEVRQTLRGVVPYFHVTRALFLGEGQDRPDCSSMDGKYGVYFDVELNREQRRECATCPFNKYGSDPKGGKGKACKEMRRLFLLEEGSNMSSVVTLPPTSLKVWDRFVSGLLYKGTPLAAVEVELSLEAKQNGAQTWSVLKSPQIVRRLSPVEYVKVRSVREELEQAAQRYTVGLDDYMQGAGDEASVTADEASRTSA